MRSLAFKLTESTIELAVESNFSTLSEALSNNESALAIVLLACSKSAFLHIVNVLRANTVNINFFILDNFVDVKLPTL